MVEMLLGLTWSDAKETASNATMPDSATPTARRCVITVRVSQLANGIDCTLFWGLRHYVLVGGQRPTISRRISNRSCLLISYEKKYNHVKVSACNLDRTPLCPAFF